MNTTYDHISHTNKFLWIKSHCIVLNIVVIYQMFCFTFTQNTRTIYILYIIMAMVIKQNSCCQYTIRYLQNIYQQSILSFMWRDKLCFTLWTEAYHQGNRSTVDNRQMYDESWSTINVRGIIGAIKIQQILFRWKEAYFVYTKWFIDCMIACVA